MNGSLNFSDLARSFDARERPIEAAWAYEIAIASGDLELDLILDLAVLYFVCVDFGYATRHQLSREFVYSAWIRAFQILEVGDKQTGNRTELQFWKHYFRSVYLKDEGIEELSVRLVQRNDSPLPAMYLYLAGNTEFKDKTLELLESVKSGATERERYVRSIIEAQLLRDPLT